MFERELSFRNIRVVFSRMRDTIRVRVIGCVSGTSEPPSEDEAREHHVPSTISAGGSASVSGKPICARSKSMTFTFFENFSPRSEHFETLGRLSRAYLPPPCACSSSISSSLEDEYTHIILLVTSVRANPHICTKRKKKLSTSELVFVKFFTQ